MSDQDNRENLNELTKQELIELCLSLLKNEQELIDRLKSLLNIIN